MAPGSKRSFGSALFDWPAADGYDSADEHAPETWLELLVEKLFSGRQKSSLSFREGLSYGLFRHPELGGLFRSCKGGRDLVLTRAREIGIHLGLGGGRFSLQQGQDKPAQKPITPRQLSATRQCLVKRGSAPTQIIISGYGNETTAEALIMLPGLFYGAGQGVSELHLDLTSSWSPPLPQLTTWLCCCGDAFPNLNTLTLMRGGKKLPEPARLPNLRHLSLPDAPHDDLDTTTRSIASFLPLLESLDISGSELHRRGLWPLLFNEASTSNTLVKLDVDAELSAPLVRLLAAHCPALKELKTCGQEPITSEDISNDLQWAVTCVDTFNDFETASDVSLDGIMLPRPPEGTRTEVRLYKTVTMPVDTQGGFSPEVYQRVCGLSFECDRVRVVLSDSVEPHHHTQALEAVLGQLKELIAPEAMVEIRWQWTTDMLQTFSASLPELSHLKLGVRLHTPLTDALLGVVLQMAPHLRSLSAPSLALQSDTHANTPWPWDELTIDTLDIVDLCKLPDAGPVRRDMYNSEAIVDVQSVTKVGTDLVRERLQRIEWHTETHQTWTLTHSPDIMTTLKALRPSLHFASINDCHYAASLKPSNWPMTKQGLQDIKSVHKALCKRGINWETGSLDMSDGCTWPERDVSVYEEWAKEFEYGLDGQWRVCERAPYNVIQSLKAGLAAQNRSQDLHIVKCTL